MPAPTQFPTPPSWRHLALACSSSGNGPTLKPCSASASSSAPSESPTLGRRSTPSRCSAPLLGLKKHTEAETLLLAGYKGMKKQEAQMPPQSKIRISESLQRLVQLYEAMGKKHEATKWRNELEGLKPP